MNLSGQQRRKILKNFTITVLAMLLALIVYYKLLLNDSIPRLCTSAIDAPMPAKSNVPAVIDRPLPAGSCRAYVELRNVNFLHKSIRENICEGAVAYTIVDSAFPLCRLRQNMPKMLTDAVRAGSSNATLKSPVSQRSVPCFVYSASDHISDSIRRSHIFEESSIRTMQRIVNKFKENSPLTFVDIGSNIGVFTLSVLDLGVPVIALDANIRNLMRIKLSSEASSLPHKLHLLWNFISRQVSLMYLQFPPDCNVGGATKLDRAIVDTIPTMSATADSIVPLIDTKMVVLKVDIEGGEGEFFKSAQKMFDSFTIPVVHMEWLKRHMSEEERLFMIKFFTDRRYSARSVPAVSKLVGIGDKAFESGQIAWVREDFVGPVLESLK